MYSLTYYFSPFLLLRVINILSGSHGHLQYRLFLFPLQMDVSCDHDLIGGMSGTQSEKSEPPIASASTPLPAKQRK